MEHLDKARSGLLLLLAAFVLALPAGCERDDAVGPASEVQGDLVWDQPVDWDHDGLAPFLEKDTTLIFQQGRTPPAELADVTFAGEELSFWPYTGMSFDGDPSDPINLIFTGAADPLQIRTALLALDGDRTAFGLPAAPPFDQIWTDAIGGDVQTSWAEGEGWVGSVVQLQLGDYAPIRFHLRLFRSGKAFGAGGVWTLGGAHFEVMIPGTAEHQVLSWELAQDLVVADLVRSGLLDPDLPLQPTGPINAAPSFRDVAPEIYNALPDELKLLTGGPLGPVSEPVPLASDGEGIILNLAGSLPVTAGTHEESVVIDYGQFVPRPFCADGPYDWLYVEGPVTFTLRTRVDRHGLYSASGGYAGTLTATPVDIATGQPIGETFRARVSSLQYGLLGNRTACVLQADRKLTREAAGPQITLSRLQVTTFGLKTYYELTHCLDE